MEEQEKVYTQGQWQKMATAQYAAGMEAAMKAAGFAAREKDGDFKGQLAAFDAHVRGLAAAGEAEKVTVLERQMLAMRLGVPQEKAGRYVQMAALGLGEGEDFEGALKAVVAEFPPAGEGAAVRVVASTPGGTGEKRWKEMTLAERTALYRRDAAHARALAAESGEVLR